MSQRWAVHLDKTEADSVKMLRCAEGAEILEQENDIWVRGETMDECLSMVLRKHPHARRHWISPDGQLVRPGENVPNGYLPEGAWSPLREWMEITLPPAAFAASFDARVPVRTVRTSVDRNSNLLVTDLEHWTRLAEHAPLARLRRLQFVCAADGVVVVCGTPLPSMPGIQFVEENGIAVPAGWRWDPPVDSDILRELLGLQEQDVALLNLDNRWERIRSEHFVRASRSAVRMTAREYDRE